MVGWMIVNGFLKGAKYSELAEALKKSFGCRGRLLEIMTNTEALARLGGGIERDAGYLRQSGVDFVVFWDKDIRLAEYLESCGVRVYNPSEAIAVCDDKALMYVRLCGRGIRMPATMLTPKMFFAVNKGEYPGEYLDAAEKNLGFPMVVKDSCGSFGQQVFLVNGRAELEALLAERSPASLVLQSFVKESSGRDLRLEVVGGRVVAAMKRSSQADFRANISNGGIGEPYEPDDAQKQMALDVCGALKLDFAGVDILFGRGGEPVLCEVNSNAHFINISRVTGVDVSGLIAEYILRDREKGGGK